MTLVNSLPGNVRVTASRSISAIISRSRASCSSPLRMARPRAVTVEKNSVPNCGKRGASAGSSSGVQDVTCFTPAFRMFTFANILSHNLFCNPSACLDDSLSLIDGTDGRYRQLLPMSGTDGRYRSLERWCPSRIRRETLRTKNPKQTDRKKRCGQWLVRVARGSGHIEGGFRPLRSVPV